MVAFWGKDAARLAAAIGAIVMMLGAVTPATADTAIAKAAEVRPQANAVLNGATVVLSVADDLFEGQTITTGSRGQVQIVFADETRMVVGPGSSLVIQSILMRNGKATDFAVSALGGTFRFITGKSNKSAYKIDTPTGTIGVRGTKFDFKVSKKKTDIKLYEGEVTYCPDGGDCGSVKGECQVGSGTSSNLGEGSSSGFTYSQSQSSLRTDFRVAGAGQCGVTEVTTSSNEAKSEAAPAPPGKDPGNPDPIPDPLPN